jgi:hypothetical protein
VVADELENCRVIDFFLVRGNFCRIITGTDVNFLVSSSQIVTNQFSNSGPRILSNVRRSKELQADDIRNRI